MSTSISGRTAILGIAIFVAVGLVVTVAVWLAMRGPDNKAAITAAEEAGRAYAVSATDQACVPEALRRADECRAGAMCTVKEQAFLNACLEGAAVTPELCEGVPEKTRYTLSERWREAVCADLGRKKDFPCTQIVRVLQRTCDRRR